MTTPNHTTPKGSGTPEAPRPSKVAQEKKALAKLHKKLERLWDEARIFDKTTGLASSSRILAGIEDAISACYCIERANGIHREGDGPMELNAAAQEAR